MIKFSGWMIVALIIAFLFLAVIVWVNMHPYSVIVDFRMDDNTLAAVKSINWSTVKQ